MEVLVMTHLPGALRNPTPGGLPSGIAGSSSPDKGINNRNETIALGPAGNLSGQRLSGLGH